MNNSDGQKTAHSRVGKGEFDSVDFQFTPKPLSEPYSTIND